jgi:hypothetical protein
MRRPRRPGLTWRRPGGSASRDIGGPVRRGRGARRLPQTTGPLLLTGLGQFADHLAEVARVQE